MDHGVYNAEYDHLIGRDWFIAGFSSEIANPGDYRIVDYAGESIILTRDEQGTAHGLVNSCRHRGSQVCSARSGRAKAFVCPYHAWSYRLNGDLWKTPGAVEIADRATMGLKRVAVREIAGVVFMSLDPNAPGLDLVAARMADYLAPFGLAQTKVVARHRYEANANWKLVAENYFECYHCLPAHPEYCRTRSEFASMTEDALAAEEAAQAAYSRSVGIDLETQEPDWADSTPGIPFVGYYRNYLKPGYQTMTADGRLAAPLLGTLSAPDGSETDILFGPNSHLQIYCDYAVLFRFIPMGPQSTLMEAVWIVRDDAEIADPEALTALWHVTTQQDVKIIERNQRGVASRFFTPGPLAAAEGDTRHLMEWYIQRMAQVSGTVS